MQFETVNDALLECVRVCGGAKVVGPAIWPAKGAEAAQRHLLNCLNPDRQEKLGPDEVVLVFRLARQRGCHGGMEFLAETLGYAAPVPVQAEDEAAQLQREFIQSSKQMAKLVERIEVLTRGG